MTTDHDLGVRILSGAPHKERNYNMGFQIKKNNANFVPLTPLSFLYRTAEIFPKRLAWIYGNRKANYRELFLRSKNLAVALKKLKVKPNPIKKELYSVNVPVKQKLIDVDVSVVNKTREKLIDRVNFLQKIKPKLNIEIKSPVLRQEYTKPDSFMKKIGKPKKIATRE